MRKGNLRRFWISNAVKMIPNGYTSAMMLTVNGETTKTNTGQSVRDLVVELGLGGRAVAVEVNKQLIPRKQHGHTCLQNGDVVEIVTLVGGG